MRFCALSIMVDFVSKILKKLKIEFTQTKFFVVKHFYVTFIIKT